MFQLFFFKCFLVYIIGSLSFLFLLRTLKLKQAKDLGKIYYKKFHRDDRETVCNDLICAFKFVVIFKFRFDLNVRDKSIRTICNMKQINHVATLYLEIVLKDASTNQKNQIDGYMKQIVFQSLHWEKRSSTSKLHYITACFNYS